MDMAWLELKTGLVLELVVPLTGDVLLKTCDAETDDDDAEVVKEVELPACLLVLTDELADVAGIEA